MDEGQQQSSTAVNALLIALAAVVIGVSVFFAFRHSNKITTNITIPPTNTQAAKNSNTGKFEGDSITVRCSNNSDCVVWGCSKQLCGRKEKVKDLTTSCEYKEVYACTKVTTCGCFEGECQWQQTPDYASCVAEKQSS